MYCIFHLQLQCPLCESCQPVTVRQCYNKITNLQSYSIKSKENIRFCCGPTDVEKKEKISLDCYFYNCTVYIFRNLSQSKVQTIPVRYDIFHLQLLLLCESCQPVHCTVLFDSVIAVFLPPRLLQSATSQARRKGRSRRGSRQI